MVTHTHFKTLSVAMIPVDRFAWAINWDLCVNYDLETQCVSAAECVELHYCTIKHREVLRVI